MRANRYVIDSNIYVSYIISGRLHKLVAAVLDNELLVFTCPELDSELTAVLERSHLRKYLAAPADEYLALIRSVTVPVKFPGRFSGSPDPKDDYLFALCLRTRATLVTGDKALQRFAGSPVPVISLTAFRSRI